MALLNEKLLNGFLNKVYPIGKTEFFLDNEDHSNYMGFTWQLDCKGRVPVGLDTSDTDFNVIGKTGGSKYLQAHYHIQNMGEKNMVAGSGSHHTSTQVAGEYANNTGNITSYQQKTSTEGTGDSGNLQPYKVFAVWVRIA